jgi:hypothetical protein
MKKTLITLALATAVVSTGLAQGTINWANANNSKISVNATVGGPATAVMVANAGTLASTYYFALFYSTTASLVGGSSSAIMGSTGATYAFNDSSWNFLNPSPISGFVVGPAYGTNTTIGKFTVGTVDPTTGAVITPTTTPSYFVVVGWSANIGSTIGQLENWYSAPSTNGWIGESIVFAQATPGNPLALPPGTTPNIIAAGQGFTLGEVAGVVPEPTTIALFGLGGLALLAFRRRQ